jgi:hypothetical protein
MKNVELIENEYYWLKNKISNILVIVKYLGDNCWGHNVDYKQTGYGKWVIIRRV